MEHAMEVSVKVKPFTKIRRRIADVTNVVLDAKPRDLVDAMRTVKSRIKVSRTDNRIENLSQTLATLRGIGLESSVAADRVRAKIARLAEEYKHETSKSTEAGA